MLLAIDVGNTNIVIGLYKEDTKLGSWRIRTNEDVTGDELWVILKNLMFWQGLETSEIRGVIIACVVPPLKAALEETFPGLSRNNSFVRRAWNEDGYAHKI